MYAWSEADRLERLQFESSKIQIKWENKHKIKQIKIFIFKKLIIFFSLFVVSYVPNCTKL